ncbi:MAG: hypothetical protein HRU70_01825 [Phycisphaeraceae bacterium]|nr:MAG: hypothetical protein HRU70_01825 [Phycisphaeraceae bacterium]
MRYVGLVHADGRYRFDTYMKPEARPASPSLAKETHGFTIATHDSVVFKPGHSDAYTINPRPNAESPASWYEPSMAPWPILNLLETQVRDQPDARDTPGDRSAPRRIATESLGIALEYDAGGRLVAIQRDRDPAAAGEAGSSRFAFDRFDDRGYPKVLIWTVRRFDAGSGPVERVLTFDRVSLAIDPPDAEASLAFDPATTRLHRRMANGDIVNAKGEVLYNEHRVGSRIMADLTGATERRWWVWGVVAGVLLLAAAGLVARQRKSRPRTPSSV